MNTGLKISSFPKDRNSELPLSLRLYGQYLHYLFSLEKPSEGAGSQGISDRARWEAMGGWTLHLAGPLHWRKEPLSSRSLLGTETQKPEKEKENQREQRM